jgi:VWFA-related protein
MTATRAVRMLLCPGGLALLLNGQAVEKPVPPKAGSDAGNSITLNVVANDKSGKPVAGLQQKDFTILDNKQPRPILSFREVSGRDATYEPVQVILILDAVNLPYTRVAYARDQVKRFLRQDNGALARPIMLGFLSDKGLDLQGVPSRDGNALVNAIDQDPNILRIINRSQGFWGRDEQTNISVRSIEQLSEYAASLPGRKLVICLSPGWPMLSGPNVQLSRKSQEYTFNTIVSLSTDLREAGVTLYAIDPLGTDDSGAFRTFYWESFTKGVRSWKETKVGDLALQVLAFQSGGRVLNSNNDVSGEIETAVKDASRYYVLTFASAPGDGPDDYHAIQVKLDQPKLKAQTLTGYYAQPSRIGK